LKPWRSEKKKQIKPNPIQTCFSNFVEESSFSNFVELTLIIARKEDNFCNAWEWRLVRSNPSKFIILLLNFSLLSIIDKNIKNILLIFYIYYQTLNLLWIWICYNCWIVLYYKNHLVRMIILLLAIFCLMHLTPLQISWQIYDVVARNLWFNIKQLFLYNFFRFNFIFLF